MKEIIAIDVDVSMDNIAVQSEGTAFYRLPDDVLDFFKKCEEKHGILGFNWDGSRNFGVVLRNQAKTQKPEREWELHKQYGRDMHDNPFFEALCPHGIGHHKGVHGCDGCCNNAPKDIWKKVSKD